ncbi:hypothetical protein [Acetivibrio ethanolgignens]|uniref:HipA N-terminal subdomain 1 domain-containing protein n=1 Tax=Acetivibrio ethanolgignens TaxID=290052 RepID=A0A0V8QCD8_9FIRM|nr:hypothetical protein [Acetivibrio ethanolgignens]KSV58256.1 hypothetical protein ASU35_13415 [Acetivibrio ethanolgignens]
MEGVVFCCDVYHRYAKTGRLEIVNGKLIKNEVYTSNVMLHPFPKSTTFFDVTSSLEERVIPPCRWTADVANYLGLQEYNVYDILRKTHGVLDKDFLWFKFDDDPTDLTWDDVKVRG